VVFQLIIRYHIPASLKNATRAVKLMQCDSDITQLLNINNHLVTFTQYPVSVQW